MRKPPELIKVNLADTKGINFKGHTVILTTVIKSCGFRCRKARTVLLKGTILLLGET
jgi:hypothetical protein